MSSTAVQELISSLEALLALLRQGGDRLPTAYELPSAYELSYAAQRFHTLCHTQAADIDAESRMVLIRGLCEVGPLLARLDSKYQRAGGYVTPLVQGIAAAGSAALLGSHLRLSVPEWQQLSAAAALLLGSGTAALEQAVAKGSPATSLIAAHFSTAHYLHSGAFNAVQACSSDSMRLPHALPGIEPAAAAKWLGALGAAACREVPGLDAAGQDTILAGVCETAVTFLSWQGPQASDGYTEVQAAVGSNPTVQQQLVRAVRYCLQRSSAQVLQRTVTGNPGSGDVQAAWEICARAVQLATAPPLLPAMLQQAQQPQAQAAVWPLVFRLAEQLPVLPLVDVPEESHAALWAEVLQFFLEIVRAAADAEQGLHAGLRTRLVGIFPRAAAALKTVSGMPGVGDRLHQMFCGTAALAYSVSRAAPETPEQLGALLAAADAAQRLLPLAVQYAAAATSGTHSPAEARCAAAAAERLLPCLGDQVFRNTVAGCVFVDNLPEHQPDAQQPERAALAQLTPRALQLHGSTCRLVHWTAQLPAAQQVLVLQSVHGWPNVSTILNNTHGLAIVCTSAATDRRLQLGASAAQVEACLVERSCAGWGPGCSPASALPAAAFAARLLSSLQDPLTATMDRQLLAELTTAVMPLTSAGAHSEHAVRHLLAAATRSPAVCSMLLQDGTLQRLLSAHAALPDGNRHAAMILLSLVGWGMEAADAAASAQLTQQLHAAVNAYQPFQPGGQRPLEFLLSPAEWLAGTAQSGPAHPIITLAQLLLQHWQSPEQQAAARLELARAAATRPCAYLRCANLGAEAGPEPGQQPGSKRCGRCRAVRYCGTACSHADWRGPHGHRRMCAALAPERGAGMPEGQEPGQAADGQAN